MTKDQSGNRPLRCLMAAAEKEFPPGLYLVATPIGSARDITLRALDVMRTADVIAAEDTRSARRLMAVHGIGLAGRRLISYHDGNGSRQRPAVLRQLKAGKSVCLVSDAGSPLIADPGLKLTRQAAAAGISVHVVPGPCAVIASLSVSGLPTDRFMFAGFLPAQAAARSRFLEELAGIQATLVFFESARRLADSLGAIRDAMGPGRRAAVCREITKKFEEVWQGSAAELAERAAETPHKGEIVILLDRQEREDPSAAELETDLRRAMSRMSVRDAVEVVSRSHGAKRRDVYRLALSIGLES